MSIDYLQEILVSMADRLSRHVGCVDEVVMLGIHTGGVWVAERLHRLMGLPIPLGQLNIAFYRDDFSQIGLHPTVLPSTLPMDITNRHIILVDDVIHSGRTIRAALNEIFDYGRPARVTLAVLVSREGRDLPIQPDIVGCVLNLDGNKYVELSGPEPLTLEIKTSPTVSV